MKTVVSRNLCIKMGTELLMFILQSKHVAGLLIPDELFILMFGYDLIKQSPSDFHLLLVKL